jgi:hypothetical protein
VAPFEPGDDLVHPIQVDDGRAVSAEELGRVQPRFQVGQRATDGKRSLCDVDDHLLTFDADPIDLARVQYAHTIPIAHRQPGQIMSLGGQVLQQRRQLRGKALRRACVRIAHPGQPLLGAAERRFEALAAERFEQVIQCVDLKGTDGILIVCGDKDDGRGRLQRLDDAETIQTWHLNIQQHQIGGQGLDHLQRLYAVPGLTDDFCGLDLGQQAAQPLPRWRFVVHDKDVKCHLFLVRFRVCILQPDLCLEGLGITIAQFAGEIGIRTVTTVPRGSLSVTCSP